MKELTDSERLIITKYDLLYEQRLTKVEITNDILAKEFQDVKNEIKSFRNEIRSDVRWGLGIFLSSYAGLFLIIAHGLKWF